MLLICRIVIVTTSFADVVIAGWFHLGCRFLNSEKTDCLGIPVHGMLYLMSLLQASEEFRVWGPK
jgi:hypothetical protein